MADEIRVTLNVSYENTSGSGLKRTIQPGTLQIDQSAIGVYGGMQAVGTSSTTITALADAGTEGWMFLRNLDAANFITYGSSLLEFKLKAGEHAWQRVTPSATVQIKADTASVNVETVLFED